MGKNPKEWTTFLTGFNIGTFLSLISLVEVLMTRSSFKEYCIILAVIFAIVAGIKDNKYYIAESLWYAKPYNGALIKEYTKEALVSNFYWHVDMNDYYKEDGNYTEYWSY